MHICIHLCIHTYIHTHSGKLQTRRIEGELLMIEILYIHTYMHTYIHTHIRTNIHTYIHTVVSSRRGELKGELLVIDEDVGYVLQGTQTPERID